MVMNGSVVMSRNVKWKPRHVSAVRDFPRGCGPAVSPVNDGGTDGAQVAESVSLLANGENVVVDKVEGSGPSVLVVNDGGAEGTRDEAVALVTNGESVVVVEEEVSGALVNDGGMEGARVESLSHLQNGESEEVQKVEVGGSANVNVVVEGGDVKMLVQENVTENGVSGVVKEDVREKKFPRRRVSAVRDFPPFCGPDAVEPTEEDRMRINGSSYKNGNLTEATVGGETSKSKNEKLEMKVVNKNVKLTEATVVGGETSKSQNEKSEMKVDDKNVKPTEATVVGGETSKSQNEKSEMKVDDKNVKLTEATVVGCETSKSQNDKSEMKVLDKNVKRTEATVVGGETSKSQNDKLEMKALDKNLKLTEGAVVGGEVSESQNEKSETKVEDENVGVLEEPCRELVVYKHDNDNVKPVNRVCSDDDEDYRDDFAIEEMVSRSVELVNKNIKNVNSEKMGRDKRSQKRPLDDGARHMVIGLEASDDERDYRDVFEKQRMVKNSSTQKLGRDKRVVQRSTPIYCPTPVSVGGRKVSDDEEDYTDDYETQETFKNIGSQKVGRDKRVDKRPFDDSPRALVVGLTAPSAPSLFEQGSVKLHLTNVNDSAKCNAKRTSTTPEKRVKKKHKKQVKVFGESSGTGKAVVPYSGTHEMVVKEEEDTFVKTEEQDGVFNNSYGPHDLNVSLPPFGPRSSNDARNKVREILRLFHALCRKLLQGEESKTDFSKLGLPKKRVDLAAKAILEERGKLLVLGKKQCGPVPGVEVGDEFQYRVELALVGIHRPFQGGIDSVRQGTDYVAVSVVASGGYDNEVDKPDCLIYSGAGGVTKEKTFEDQKLERGNLALYDNIALGLPVRVVRGFKSKSESEDSDLKPKIMTTYIYDGLYRVADHKKEPGPNGNLVYKFILQRLPGQPELAVRQVKSKKFKTTREGVCVNDIACGKERFRICAINTIDDEKPPVFTYITKIMYPDWYHPVLPKGCDCVGRCSDKKCSCAFLNGGEIPFNRNGAIVEAKPLVYECGPSCGCPPSCYNRVTQHGMKLQLEIFKTESRGWGVRSLSSISSGSFICEYIGELLEDTEAEKRTGNDEYLFDIGQNYNDCSLNPDANANVDTVDKYGFTIDALHYGNVGRFINHSCSPNLYAQNVLYDQEDKRMPHIMLFAAENIPPLQELTYHYNYAVDTVHDSDGNIKIKHCYCGSSECTGRLY